MSAGLKKKFGRMFQCTGRGRKKIFHGSHKNFIENGRILLEERISLFNGRANPIRCFSVDELNAMKVDPIPIFRDGFFRWHKGAWEGRCVLVKIRRFPIYNSVGFSREIAVVTEMGTHGNVHKLLGCCLETQRPVLVYEHMQLITLQDALFGNIQPLEWEDRLRIAWEISRAVAYLHSAFPRPIIHRDLKPSNVLLDQHNSPRLSEFCDSVSIPEGEEFVTADALVGTFGYMAREYLMSNKVTEGVDVYSFGVIFLVLLTGKRATIRETTNSIFLTDWVKEGLRDKSMSEIVDPNISNKNGATTDEHLQQQLRASFDLALKCTEDDRLMRPTMVDVATQLQTLISSPQSIPSTSSSHSPYG